MAQPYGQEEVKKEREVPRRFCMCSHSPGSHWYDLLGPRKGIPSTV